VALIGVNGQVVEVEADITNGLVGMILIGLPDTALREARDRIRAAIANSGEEWPQRKITVGLSPASLPKRGSWFDLATPITDFQRQHRRNVETGCRGGTEGGEVTAEECCIAPRCRVEPFLDQGGAARGAAGPASAPRAQP
jgi:hypothetical protein